MGFTRLTPENASATRRAGMSTFIGGGAVLVLLGIGGVALAIVDVISFAWEAIALLIIGALIGGVAAFILSKSAENR